MSKINKIILKVLSGKHDNSMAFTDILYLLENLDFDIRIKGDHHIFSHKGIPEIINIQPISHNKAKPYQVKQIRNLIVEYKLGDYKNE